MGSLSGRGHYEVMLGVDCVLGVNCVLGLDCVLNLEKNACVNQW